MDDLSDVILTVSDLAEFVCLSLEVFVFF